MIKKYEFIAQDTDHKKRLDTFLSQQELQVSRSQIKRLIDTEFVQVNNIFPKAGLRVKEGDLIRVFIPKPNLSDPSPENIPLDIIYEDRSIIVINKPPGLVIHPAPGNYSGTLVNALLFHVEDLSGIGGAIRPGIVHRLDKNTSGVLIVAKNDLAHQSLADQFKKHSITRRYFAIVYGNLEDKKGTVNACIGRHILDRKKMSTKTKKGKEAITHWRVIESFGNFSLLEISLETGRTHQIRVHLADIQHPIIGDPVYCRKLKFSTLKDDDLIRRLKSLNRQALHAYVLGINHPIYKEYIEFTAPMPEDMKKVLDMLRRID
ncbi:MAG: RluA family pseudouridine synthase [Thermodesulfobacteriota bacterium]|nr:RluA family pseudouridine synthase [Thermodesulfobacteriota bacterium]